jgi:hypothetical protein
LILLWPNGIEIRGAQSPTFMPLTRVAGDPRGILDLGDSWAISDAQSDSILRLDRSGEARAPVAPPRSAQDRFDGQKANEDGSFWIPARMSAGSDGAIFAVDYGNHRLQRFGRDGDWQATFTLSRSRARDKSAPSAAPTNAEMQRAEARRLKALDRARAGSGSVDIPGGGRIEWRTQGAVPRGEPFAMQVRAIDAEGKSLEGQSLGVDCTMPHHGHGMNVRPVVTQDSPGCWSVDPMLLHMPGRWELCFDLAGADRRTRRTQTTLEVE